MSELDVKKQLTVRASQERAFKVFTDGIDRWWPREHHIGKSPLKREIIEPKLGGRWYAISEDESECEVGKVLVWEPFDRVVLSWQINADWKFAPDFITEIEVTFKALGPKETRVDFVHRNLERYGARADELSKILGSEKGWGATLSSFVASAEEAS
jgi:Activator of Hsp90 ATPase homolog 1-like protein